MQSVLTWIQEYSEILALISGLIYIFFSIKQIIWLWPLGIISSALQLIVFFEKGIYADMSLQAYYVLISFYGWYSWRFGKPKNAKKLPVIKMNQLSWIIFIISTLLIFVIIRFVLVNFTNETVPNLDSLTTALSITGTVLLARKFIENWLVWVVVDVISTGLYIYKEIYYLSALYFVLTVLAIVGYVSWKKDLRNE